MLTIEQKQVELIINDSKDNCFHLNYTYCFLDSDLYEIKLISNFSVHRNINKVTNLSEAFFRVNNIKIGKCKNV